MRKTAKLLLVMVIVLFFNIFGPITSEVESTGIGFSVERHERYMREQEIERKANVEKQMLDSLLQKPSIKWLLTGFTEDQIFKESTGNQNAISPEGAVGIAQFLPATWNYLVQTKRLPEWFDINNETHQRIAQLVYLDYLYTLWEDRPRDRKALTVASYNAGPGRVAKEVRHHGTKWRNHVPAETQDYLNHLKKYI